ncbi:uncharacterized protein LOC115752413 [Rhodamnia argentea]|uniref:Uncharacterized protein LOC115752413 n=1 Tax=Rhodamnia argentea TaxID=178133 RepID=A0A8B8QJN0_9MYRT|nr:uncharacterized protein LOC115752413 [Rhodamnia argentea]XP_048132329.1 uncharacterized protein LOC115752413 [Rhodamnia argentea]XP_048132330.1 uncharacterized protein LOC115752413 [Rhodamnia argentea]
MGCISSKVVSRSISYREELNQGSRSTGKSIVALEDIFSSNKGSDQFLTLVCTANTVANRLRCESINSESKTSPRSTKATFEIDRNCDCSAVSEGGTEGNRPKPAISQLFHEDSESFIVEPPKRSRSWHSFFEEEMPSANAENYGKSRDRSEWEYKGVGRSRSFHTVEEYDALLARILSTSVSHDDYVAENQEKTPHTESSMHSDQNKYNIKTEDRAPQNDDVLVDKNIANDEPVIDYSITVLVSGSETKEVIPSSLESRTSDKLIAKDDVAQEERCMIERGFKRKVIARGLESLAIPSTVELPAVASLREWLPARGQVYSPGTYTTPKFGTYSLPESENLSEATEDNIFTKELVLAIEEHMQELEAEEETILKQIADKWEREGAKENLDEVATT